MRISKLFSGLLVMALLASGMTATVQASTSYEYIPGYGMVEVEEVDPYPTPSVDNSGTFGLSVENFRYMCTTTGGDWDVAGGRHVCYCPEGEFNYPFGCPDVIIPEPYYPDYNDDYDYDDPYPDYGYDVHPDYDEDYYYGDDYDDGYYDYNGFDDVYGHKYERYILKLADMGIIKGYGDGSFRPNAPVSRAEMAKMVMMASNLETLPCDEDRNRFFADLDDWQAPWVNAGYRMDIIEGYTSSASGVRLFKPNNNVNRVEGVKLVLAAFGRTPHGYDHNFESQYSDITGWMTMWIEDAFRIGLIEDANRFYPGDAMTRGMAAKVIVKMLEYSGDI